MNEHKNVGVPNVTPTYGLSFDDGPAPVGALLSILETLKKNGIKAEFYVLGSEVKKYPKQTKMIVDQGS